LEIKEHYSEKPGQFSQIFNNFRLELLAISKYNTALVEGCCDVLQVRNVKALGSTIGQTSALINNGIRELNDQLFLLRRS